MVSYKDVFYKGKQPSRVCLFCEPNEGMTLLETDNFRLIADTYPITSGHFMLSTKAHFSSGGEVTKDLHEEFLYVKSLAKDIGLAMHEKCVFYEHGKAGSCHANSQEDVHCEHFHMHCLPVSIDIHAKIAKHFQGIKMNSLVELFSNYQKYGSYLFFEDADGQMVYYPAEEHKVPPHFLRTLICEELDVATLSDWQAYDMLDRYVASRERLADALCKESPYALL